LRPLKKAFRCCHPNSLPTGSGTVEFNAKGKRYSVLSFLLLVDVATKLNQGERGETPTMPSRCQLGFGRLELQGRDLISLHISEHVCIENNLHLHLSSFLLLPGRPTYSARQRSNCSPDYYIS
jgi:hypothetical protein